ncbi:MAG: hypothetical protein ACLP50_31000 [Solirubrobacteraceae bacterium]
MSCLNPLHWAGCIVHGVGTVAGSVAGDVFDQVATDFAQFAEHATTWVWKELDAATAVKLSGASWDGVLQVTVEIGVLVCVTMFLLQVILSALRREVGGMGRAVRGVMIAMIGTFASFIITDSLLTLVDSMSTGVMQLLAGTSTWADLGSKVVNAQTLTGGALGSAAMLLCALVMLVSSLVVWLALTVRKMLVIVGAAFAPIAFGGSPFDVTTAWVRRWIELTAALIFSKLILVLLFGIGLQIELGLGEVGTGTAQQITQMMTGLLVMTIAGFAPWLAIQFVQWAGSSLQQVHQHGQAASAAGQTAIAAPQRMYAGARDGAGGLAVAASKLSSGANGSDSSNGGSGGTGGAPGGGQGGGSTPGGGGAATATAESAYESGKSQTAQAMGQNGGEPGGAQQSGSQQQGSQQQGGRPQDGQGQQAGSDGGDSGAASRGSSSGNGQSSGAAGGGASSGGDSGGGGQSSAPSASPAPAAAPGGGGGPSAPGGGRPSGGGSPGGEPSGPGGGGAAGGGAEIAAA